MGLGRFAWLLCAVVLGCSNGPQRTLDRDAVVPSPDFGPPDAGVPDGLGTDTDTGPGTDANMDARQDSLSDTRTELSDARTDRVTGDGSSDGGDASPRDIVMVESSVMGCMANADCVSEGLYCNASACGVRGFCTPRSDPMSCSTDGGETEIVCGCDGMSYPSLCALQSSGVRLVAFGPCVRE